MSQNEVVGHISSDPDISSAQQSLQATRSLQISVSSMTNSILFLDREQYMFTRMAERHEMVMNRLANAHDAYSATVARYGIHSPEAARAFRNLEVAQMMNTRLTQQMAFQHEMYMLRSIPMMLSSIVSLIAAFTALAAARTAAEWFIGGTEMIAAGAMIYLTMQSFQKTLSETTGVTPSDTTTSQGSGGDTVMIYLQGGDWNSESANRFMDALQRRQQYTYGK